MIPDVPGSFAGRCVLITGATGFIGKVLVEKILRCCPHVKRLYLLIRPGRKGETIELRLQTLLQAKLFDRLRECQPDFADKLVPIKADLLQPRLGLSDEDALTLQSQVSIVFHVAATIKFNEVLRLSLQLNVTAVRMLLELCRGMDLQVFVHVSTAYSNCPNKTIEEKVYSPAMDPYKLLSTVDWMSDDMVNDMTPFLLGDWPNTYTFTKALAETVLVKESVGMPICIVRPSIVGAAWKDPIPGWVDNLAGASGLFIASTKGIIKCVIADKDMVTDLTPVDLVVNTLITSGWHTAVHRPTEVPVINVVTSPTNPITWKEVAHHLCPSSFSYTENYLLFSYLNFVGCRVPYTIADLLVKLCGKRPRMLRAFNQILVSMHTLKHFTLNEWSWKNSNYEALKDSLPEQNREDFFMDTKPLDWREYLQQYVVGISQFVLKEDLGATKRHLARMRLLRWTINSVIVAGICRLLISNSQVARNMWYLLMQYVLRIMRFIRAPLFKLSTAVRRP